jgi:hypothetical protein
LSDLVVEMGEAPIDLGMTIEPQVALALAGA